MKPQKVGEPLTIVFAVCEIVISLMYKNPHLGPKELDVEFLNENATAVDITVQCSVGDRLGHSNSFASHNHMHKIELRLCRKSGQATGWFLPNDAVIRMSIGERQFSFTHNIRTKHFRRST